MVSGNVQSNTVDLVGRIIELIPIFVNADYWIGLLDFVGSLNEITADECAEGL